MKYIVASLSANPFYYILYIMPTHLYYFDLEFFEYSKIFQKQKKYFINNNCFVFVKVTSKEILLLYKKKNNTFYNQLIKFLFIILQAIDVIKIFDKFISVLNKLMKNKISQ